MPVDVPKRLYGPANAASGDSTILTLPEGRTYLIDRVKIVNNSSSKITMKVGIGGVTDALLIFPAVGIPAKGIVDQKCDDIMDDDQTPDTMQINASASGATITVFGRDRYPHL